VLGYLKIRGLALIDDVSMELGPGMNVLTGETGAGKSMIVDSLTLLRGGRGKGELVREGADQARIQAHFSLPQDPRLLRLLSELEIPRDDESLLLERTLQPSGRGRTMANAQLATLGTLGRIGEILLDICSQHEHHGLTQVSRHLELLDAYAGLDPAVASYQQTYEVWRNSKRDLDQLRQRATDALARMDFLRFQIAELDDLRLDAEQYEEDKARLVFLRDAQRWHVFAREAQDTLYESDDAIWGRLGTLLDRGRKGPAQARALREINEQLEAAQIACAEAASAASRLADELDADPEELQAVEERVSTLEHLRRKHGCEIGELGARLQAMRAELESLEGREDELLRLEKLESESREKARELALALHEKRLASSRTLTRAIEGELAALHMPRARMDVHFESIDDAELGARGLDRVELMFSANAGEPIAPLHKVASGGELSRVLLAIKSILATGDHVVTYVFDEVDTGVGGAVAEAIGIRLKRTSFERQVLCITHLPQLAAFADRHFLVRKVERDGRTVTEVVLLDEKERLNELARMLGGAKITESAREHAAALLAEAHAVSEKVRVGGETPAKDRTDAGSTRPPSNSETPRSETGKSRKTRTSRPDLTSS
jgi:DNA repair protein RecN (Recombination protein N)